MRGKQKGFSIYSALFVSALVIFAGYFGYKIGPVYWNNFTIQSILENVASDPGSAQLSDYDLRLRVQLLLDADTIREITNRDLRISRTPRAIIISIPRETRVDFWHNIDLVLTFSNEVAIPR